MVSEGRHATYAHGCLRPDVIEGRQTAVARSRGGRCPDPDQRVLVTTGVEAPAPTVGRHRVSSGVQLPNQPLEVDDVAGGSTRLASCRAGVLRSTALAACAVVRRRRGRLRV